MITGAISLFLLVAGGLFMAASGSLSEEGSKGSARLSAVLGFALLLCAWVLA
jgi:hypothetical protein